MKRELFRYLTIPLYWITIGAGLSVRLVLGYLDYFYRNAQYEKLAIAFWDKIGSVTVGFLIILVLIHHFSVDYEKNAFPLFNVTMHGRKRLFCMRLVAGSMAVLISVFLLTVGNLSITALLGMQILPMDLTFKFLTSSLIALAGAIGFFLTSALVCDLTQNQPATMCICGLPFAVSYFVNSSMVVPPELFWFFKYGFFTELMRGKAIASASWFWSIWYLLLLACILFFAIKKRRERKEL